MPFSGIEAILFSISIRRNETEATGLRSLVRVVGRTGNRNSGLQGGRDDGQPRRAAFIGRGRADALDHLPKVGGSRIDSRGSSAKSKPPKGLNRALIAVPRFSGPGST